MTTKATLAPPTTTITTATNTATATTLTPTAMTLTMQFYATQRPAVAWSTWAYDEPHPLIGSLDL